MNQKHTQHDFCSYCGERYAALEWPRRCKHCGNITYLNPLPVAVLVLPVFDGERVGVLTVRRDIEPQRGALALPGG